MEGLDAKKYLHTTRKRFDPISLVISMVGLVIALMTIESVNDFNHLIDIRSIAIVVIGTFASLLFQFDLSSFYTSMIVILKSFLGTPEKKLLIELTHLDRAIMNGASISELREGEEITGDLLNDIVYMHNRGLLFEEIDEFVTAKISDEFLKRSVATNLLNKAAVTSPSLGLFGTVLGLIGVLKTLSHPAQIGPSMSLALMTTAYGAGLGSLLFSPLAGRLQHHNEILLEANKQLLSKIAILLNRDERRMDRTHTPILEAS
ncbi:MAG: MotA/TolQ/ExbB proton channel family protein [Bdellovibrionota bacterium]